MYRWFYWLVGRQHKRDVLVVIWGVHSADWMSALDPHAPVWNAIPDVKAVVLRSSPQQKVPFTVRAGRRAVIIPLMEEHMVRRPRGYAACVPADVALATFGDKKRFADYVGDQGLSSSCPEVHPSIEEAVFPCVIKRTNLNSAHGVEIATSREQAAGFLAREPFVGRPVVVQSLVSFETEYVVHCVCRHGRILWQVAYAYDFQKLKMRGAKAWPPVRRVTVSEAVLSQIETFLLPLEYDGPCNVDCTWDEDGRLVVFEINPRLGGSLMNPENTADLAACLARLIAHAEPEKPAFPKAYGPKKRV